MKYLFLLLFITFTSNSFAQNSELSNEEVYATVGYFSDFNDKNDYRYSFKLGFYHHLNKVWSAGLSLTYLNDVNHYEYDRFYGSTYSSNSGYTENFKYLALHVNVKAKWAIHENYNFYSHIGIGPKPWSLQKDRSDLYGEVFQTTPIGFEYGKNHIHGYAEIGYGYMSIVSAGISYRF